MLPSVAAVTDLHVEAPPAVPRRAETGAARLMPVVLAVVSVAATVYLLTSRPGAGHTPAMLVFPLMMLLSAGAMVLTGGAGRWRAELDTDRRRYLRYLDSVAIRLADSAAVQRVRLWERHPDPEDLWAVPGERLWDRIPADPDFCTVRVGLGAVVPQLRPVGPEVSGALESDPVTAAALAGLLATHDRVPDAPVTVDLSCASEVVVRGPAEVAHALARSLICRLAVAHGPADVTIAVTDPNRADWDWLKWLPHQRLPSGSAHHLDVRIAPADTELCIEVDGTAVPIGRPDGLSVVAAAALARRLAGHHPPAPDCPIVQWASDSELRGITIGTTNGEPVELDIREAAQGGIGPHGLCVGATGSGKSELLRTIAVGMIARYSPAAVNLILIDFKGGATFLEFARAPHTTAVVTNLDEEAHLVTRMREALTGEIDRRQRLLRAAGNLSSANELPDLPTLFIIVDEFSELLSRHPEFADVFVAVGRLGRSLGIHLLLASQRLEEGRLRGLESHLSYRICLKTLSETESRMVIGVPDAHHLPAQPGAAYLKAAAAEPVPFQAGYVSGRRPVRPRTSPAPRLFTGSEAPDPACGPTLLDTLSAALDLEPEPGTAVDVYETDEALEVAMDAPGIDPQRIAAAGHSYGANTMLLAAGAQVVRGGRPLDFADARIRAAVIISAPPFHGEPDPQAILSHVRIPTLHITAVADDIRIPGYTSGLADRAAVFAATGSERKALAVFRDGSHSIFTDRLGTGGEALNPQVKAATRELALDFLQFAWGGASEAVLTDWQRRYQPLVAQVQQQ